MKKTLILFAAVVAFGGIYTYAATASGTASAEIIAPLAVTKTQDIDFGKMMQPAGAETVKVTAAGAVSGASVHLGGAQNGSFSIQGQPETDVTVSIGAATLTNSASDTMTMNNYTFSKAATHALDATGKSTVNFGADLSVAAAQPVGEYSGPFTINVIY